MEIKLISLSLSLTRECIYIYTYIGLTITKVYLPARIICIWRNKTAL